MLRSNKGAFSLALCGQRGSFESFGNRYCSGVTFHDFTISHDKLGKPLLILSGQAAELASQLQVENIHLSISDERHYAMAIWILERR